jgi:hypothetical protein
MLQVPLTISWGTVRQYCRIESNIMAAHRWSVNGSQDKRKAFAAKERADSLQWLTDTKQIDPGEFDTVGIEELLHVMPCSFSNLTIVAGVMRSEASGRYLGFGGLIKTTASFVGREPVGLQLGGWSVGDYAYQRFAADMMQEAFGMLQNCYDLLFTDYGHAERSLAPWALYAFRGNELTTKEDRSTIVRQVTRLEKPHG